MDFKNLDEFNRLSIEEYTLLMKAVELKNIDRDYRIHQQAFLNFAVQAQKKSGKNKTKPVYRKFKQFYDYEAEINKVFGRKKDRFAELKDYMRRNERL